MLFEIIFTVILVVSLFPMLFSSFSKVMPVGVRIIPIIAIALLWIIFLINKFTGKLEWYTVILYIIFYFIFIMIVLPGAFGSFIIGSFDREKHIAPIITGNTGSKKEIYVIYHNGVSNFVTTVVQMLGKNFKLGNYKVTLYSATKALKLDIDKASFIGFSSPVYAGMPRAPIINFIDRTTLKNKKCFVILTGGGAVRPGATNELDDMKKIIKAKGGNVIDHVKIIASKDNANTRKQVDDFYNKLIKKL